MGKFTSETARLAGQKSKRGKAKLEPILQDAIEVLFTEGVSILYERRHELKLDHSPEKSVDPKSVHFMTF